MGSMKLLSETSAAPISDPETDNIDDAVGGSSHALSLFADIRTITGTWTISANLRLGGGVLVIATEAFTAVGRHQIALTADHLTANAAIPLPDQVDYAEDVAGTLDASVYLAVG